MGNCLFAYPDRTLSATLTGGSWSAGLPLANLKDRLTTKVARSADALAASTQFSVDFGALRAVRLVALLGSNLSAAATARVRLYADAGMTVLLYDSGSVAMPWSSIDPDTLAGWRPDWWLVLPEGLSARCALITLSDAANPAGYVEIGRSLLMPAWSPAVNLDWGNPLRYDHGATTIERALGGPRYAWRRRPQRVQQLQLSHLDSDEAHRRVLELQRQLGRDGELFFIHDPDQADFFARQRSFLATLAETDPLELPYFDNFSASLNLLEVI